MSNLLKAIQSIILNPITKLPTKKYGSNKINAVGDALEMYVQDVFAETHGMSDKARMEKLSDVFSYLGNSNNPPDAILKNGDAIEVKKVQSPNAVLALNSSYPKAKLFADSNMISKACRECEDWTEKDLLYVIGHTSDSELRYLWFIYGDCYFASRDFYKKLLNITDPLAVTSFNFLKENLIPFNQCYAITPEKVFEKNLVFNHKNQFLNVLMLKSKYESFSLADRYDLENLIGDDLSICDCLIHSPNESSTMLNAKFISFNYKND